MCANGDIPFQCLPKEIALRNGLISKKCDLIIRDECQRSWNLILRPFGTSVCIRGGWDEFRDAYCLKEGDHIMFEVVTDGETPIWKFHGKFFHLRSIFYILIILYIHTLDYIWYEYWIMQFLHNVKKHFAF